MAGRHHRAGGQLARSLVRGRRLCRMSGQVDGQGGGHGRGRRTPILLAGAGLAALVMATAALWPHGGGPAPGAAATAATSAIGTAPQPAPQPAPQVGERADPATDRSQAWERPNRGGGARGSAPLPSPAADAPPPPPPAPPPAPPTEPDPSTPESVPDGGEVVTTGTCEASYYWEPQPTASGEVFDPEAMTAAHLTLDFTTRVRVTNPANGGSVVVRINDRGPYVEGRCLDLSRGAFREIASLAQGVVTVTYEVLSD